MISRKTLLFIAGLLALLLLSGCVEDGSTPTPTATLDLTKLSILAAQTRTAVPTMGPTSTPTDTATPTASATATDTFTPTSTATPSPSSTFTPSETAFLTATATPSLTPTVRPTQPIIITPTSAVAVAPPLLPEGAPTWTPPPLDQALLLNDHYWFARPFAFDQGYTTWVSRSYPYGSTGGRGLQVHHGVDIQNPTGTPVLAVADGTVFYAGNDLGAVRFGPISNFYGNVIVIEHAFRNPTTNEPVYSLYGHLSSVNVAAGQPVRQGDLIGFVGGTGVALGPHLHLEVRVGDPYSYTATRNPELWLRPYYGYGTLAGRVIDGSGNMLREVTINMVSVSDRAFQRSAFSYSDNSVTPDATFNENFTLGDLPADYYQLVVRSGTATLYREQVYIYPNRTTFLEIRLP